MTAESVKSFPWKCEHLTLEPQNTWKEPGLSQPCGQQTQTPGSSHASSQEEEKTDCRTSRWMSLRIDTQGYPWVSTLTWNMPTRIHTFMQTHTERVTQHILCFMGLCTGVPITLNSGGIKAFLFKCSEFWIQGEEGTQGKRRNMVIRMAEVLPVSLQCQTIWRQSILLLCLWWHTFRTY